MVHQHPNYVLVLDSNGWGWKFSTPYYSTPPWPNLLVATMEHFARFRNPWELAAELPVPVLNMNHDYAFLRSAGGEALVQRYQTAYDTLKGLAQMHRDFMAELRPDGLMRGWNDTICSVRQVAPTRSFLALAGEGSASAIANILDRPQVETIGNGPSFEVRPATAEDATVVGLTTYDSLHISPSDLPGGSVTPDWVVTSNGQVIALINVVKGGVEAKIASGNDLITTHNREIPGTAVLLEVWEFDLIAHHIVRNLAVSLGRFASTCRLTPDGLAFTGAPWPVRVHSAA
jgi:hypothetical protein